MKSLRSYASFVGNYKVSSCKREKPKKLCKLAAMVLPLILIIGVFSVVSVIFIGDLNTASYGDIKAVSVYWAKSYGGSDTDIATSVQTTADGGYVVAGWTNSFGYSNYAAWVLKLNSTGNITWEKAYGGSDGYRAYWITETGDGYYVVAGYNESYDTYKFDGWVMKLNSAGDVVWQYSYGGNSGYEILYYVQETDDGGFILAGYSSSFSSGGDRDAWLLKLKSDGSVAWSKTYGGNYDDEFYTVREVSDGYIAVGYSESYSANEDRDVWAVKVDTNGNILWQHTYGGGSDDEGYAINRTSNGFVIAGYTKSYGAGGEDVWIISTDSNGNVLWDKTYGKNKDEEARSICVLNDGFAIAGFTDSFGAGYFDYWLIKTNASGGIVWQKTYGGNDYDRSYSLEHTADGGFVLAGYTGSFGAGGYDVWVVKVSGSGEISFISGSGASTSDSDASSGSSGINAQDSSANSQGISPIVGQTSAGASNTNAEVNVQAEPTEVPELSVIAPVAVIVLFFLLIRRRR